MTLCRCLECGSEIHATQRQIDRGRGKFCTPACSTRFHHRGRSKPKSEEHRRKLSEASAGRIPWNKGQDIAKQCETCQSLFSVQPNREHTARFCSRACHSAAKTKVAGSRHPLYALVDTKCQWCGEVFKVKPAKLKYGEGRFCSRQCHGGHSASLQNGRRSSIEVMIEAALVASGEVFEAQKKLAHWIVDFYLPHRRLVIECDGDYWHSKPEQIAKDARKDGWIRAHRLSVARIRESAIRAGAAEALAAAFAGQ